MLTSEQKKFREIAKAGRPLGPTLLALSNFVGHAELDEFAGGCGFFYQVLQAAPEGYYDSPTHERWQYLPTYAVKKALYVLAWLRTARGASLTEYEQRTLHDWLANVLLRDAAEKGKTE